MGKKLHKPVLLKEILALFDNVEDKTIIDCTLGYGGHSLALLKKNPKLKILGIDKDDFAISHSKNIFKEFSNRISIKKQNFSDFFKEDFTNLAGIIADIGVSSVQLDDDSRGFSFSSDFLDMRMDRKSSLRAFDVVNFYPRANLEYIFKNYADIKNYKLVVDKILKERKKQEIKTAKDLIDITSEFSYKKNIHPATLLFQAIRIEVNKELEELEKLLANIRALKPKNCLIAIISFHSIEDRIVKNTFKTWAKNCICEHNVYKCLCGSKNSFGELVNKKPIIASQEELKENFRSRSAKLRIFKTNAK